MPRVYTGGMESRDVEEALASELHEAEENARIQNLADGVFAIAMTLLMFNFRLPLDLPQEELATAFATLLPQFLTYFFSFIVLGALWIGHHSQFRLIRRSNRALLWINIFLLSFIALIPVSTALLRSYYATPIVVAAYTTNLIFCGLMLLLQWSYAAHKKFLGGTSEMIIARMKHRVWVPLTLDTIAIAGAFLSVWISYTAFAIIFLVTIVPAISDWIIRLFTQRTSQPS